MTAVLPDVDSLQQLDWDHQPPCELKRCQAGNPAATHRVWLEAPCTCEPELACRACVESLQGALEVYAWAWCNDCGAQRVCRLGDWLHLEPLA